MYPWERRLRDLAQLLKNCGDSYFSPDRFRQSINQFLQTSRTVTFIIQKNKTEIPDFDAWYRANVLEPWATDPVMSWAKDARNVIEKEGDLEMRSTLQVAVLYSYLSTEDMVLEVGRAELLKANIDQLVKTARRVLPPGIADAAVVKIQRRWVANTLPDRELIYALTYAYSQLFRVCSALAAHLNSKVDSTVPHPTSIDPSSNDVAKVRFMKLSQTGVGRHVSIQFKADPTYNPPPWLVRLKDEFQLGPKPSSLSMVVAMHAKMARLTFEQHGNHIPMLAFYDKSWNQIDFMSTAFQNQGDKYLFWRNVADRAFYLKAYAVVWTSELWLRDLKEHHDRPISELPIVGEQLHVVGADASGAEEIVTWNISRLSDSSEPVLTPVTSEDKNRPGQVFFIKPVVAAMKIAHAGDAG